MFSKLTDKFKDKLNLSSDSQPGQQPFQASSGGGGAWSKTPLGTGSKAEVYRHRYWRGVNLGECDACTSGECCAREVCRHDDNEAGGGELRGGRAPGGMR